MEDSSVFPAPQSTSTSPEEEKQASKKALIIIAVIILLLAVAGVSYIFGKKSSGETNPTPTPALTLDESFRPEELTSPTPSITPQATSSATPTKKTTSTPTQTPTPTPNIKTKIISATSSLDGFRSSNGGGNEAIEIRVGRNINLTMRGFISFDIGDIPAGATLTDATLRLYQQKTVGSPYSVGGKLFIDHLTYGDSLDNSDYAMASLTSSFATLTNNSVVEWKDSNVLTELKDDISNARSRSQYRIHFETENTGGDTTGDFAYFESAENTLATGNTPQLVVKYY